MYQTINSLTRIKGIRTLKDHPKEPMITRRAPMTVAEILHTLGRQEALIEELRMSNAKLRERIRPYEAAQRIAQREEAAIEYERQERIARTHIATMRALTEGKPINYTHQPDLFNS